MMGTRTAPLDVAALGRALRSGEPIEDEVFDRCYPPTHRHRSEIHWTPVDVALLVGRWFSRASNPRVLDVGAGVGKLCHVGALATNLVWIGIERDATMVRIATRVARALNVGSQTTFLHAEALQHEWSSYGAVYLFNPFSEACIEGEIDPLTRQAAYVHEVLSVEQRLIALSPGTLVATYHGFGGDMPSALERVETANAHDGAVELWIRKASS